jgi:hypothetical protein
VSLGHSSTFEDVAFAVCTALDRSGVTAVLTGGGAATIYAPAAYQTRDLDFILQFASEPSQEPLLEIGFRRTKNAAIYSHPALPYTLEFPPGPLAVGADVVAAWSTVKRDGEILYILSPTDCVRDRLAAAIHWNDLSSIRQAAEVAKLHHVDLKLVEQWCEHEGGRRQFRLFRNMLAS